MESPDSFVENKEEKPSPFITEWFEEVYGLYKSEKSVISRLLASVENVPFRYSDEKRQISLRDLLKEKIEDIYLSLEKLYRENQGIDEVTWNQSEQFFQNELMHNKERGDGIDKRVSEQVEEYSRDGTIPDFLQKESSGIEDKVSDLKTFRNLREWIRTAEKKIFSVSSEFSMITSHARGVSPLPHTDSRWTIENDLNSHVAILYKFLSFMNQNHAGVDGTLHHKAVRSVLE